MTDMPKKWVGTSVERKEDARLLTGKAIFVDDMKLPGMLYCSIFRSTYPHAKLKSVDVSQAAKLPGVVAIITGEDMKDYPLPPGIELRVLGQKTVTGHAFSLAVDKVRYVGEPIAAVAAVDRYVAEDALSLINVEYDLLTPVVDAEKALEKDSPLLYEEWGDNIHLHRSTHEGEVDKAFQEADHIIKEKLYEHRYSAFPLEARAILASYSAADGTLDVWSSTQAVCQARMFIARTLKLPEQNVRVIARQVGGGFGSKLNWCVDIIPALLSIKTGRPVKYTEDRRENLLGSPHSRDYIYDVQVACKNDGKILGVKIRMIMDAGIEGSNRGTGIGTLLVAGGYCLGPYKIKNYKLELIGVVTNKSFVCAYRGYGKDMGNRIMERMINIMSRELNLLPEEIRRNNFIQPDEFPYRQPTGVLYDSGNYPELINRALKRVDIEALRKEKKRLRKQGKYIGIGLASMVGPAGAAVPMCIFNGFEGATIKILSEGGVSVSTSHTSLGQGIETTLAQVVADELGVTPDDVRVIPGDTDMAQSVAGPFSSRGAVWVVGTVVKTARKVKEKALKIGAHVLQAKPEEVEMQGGKIYVKADPTKSLTLQELGRQVYYWPGQYAVTPPDLLAEDPGLEATCFWTSPSPPTSWVPPVCLYSTHYSGCEIAIIEVDISTGKVKVLKYVTVFDCGTMINPKIVEKQFHGGTLQGIGAMLYEELVYDENGQPLTTTFMDYLVPTVKEAPDVYEFEYQETPSPFTALGTKGMGEAPLVCSPGVIVNAVEDALGVTVHKTSLTPERVLGLIKQAKGKGLL
ncbi:MAG: xanthine dehydrogenase family protein molybdopterin-binding subunit [Syntrophobacteraceae bacterium]